MVRLGEQKSLAGKLRRIPCGAIPLLSLLALGWACRQQQQAFVCGAPAPAPSAPLTVQAFDYEWGDLLASEVAIQADDGKFVSLRKYQKVDPNDPNSTLDQDTNDANAFGFHCTHDLNKTERFFMQHGPLSTKDRRVDPYPSNVVKLVASRSRQVRTLRVHLSGARKSPVQTLLRFEKQQQQGDRYRIVRWCPSKQACQPSVLKCQGTPTTNPTFKVVKLSFPTRVQVSSVQEENSTSGETVLLQNKTVMLCDTNEGFRPYTEFRHHITSTYEWLVDGLLGSALSVQLETTPTVTYLEGVWNLTNGIVTKSVSHLASKGKEMTTGPLTAANVSLMGTPKWTSSRWSGRLHYNDSKLHRSINGTMNLQTTDLSVVVGQVSKITTEDCDRPLW